MPDAAPPSPSAPTAPTRPLDALRALEASGSWNEALSGYNQILAESPGQVEALLGKASLLTKMERPLLALACVDQVLAQAPDHQGALFQRGGLLFGMGFDSAADAVWRQMVQAPALTADEWAMRGAAWTNLRRYPEALQDLDRALALDATHVGAWYSKAYSLAHDSRPIQARAAYQRTIELAPDHAVARWAKPFASVPPLQPPAAERQALRQALLDDLDELDRWVGEPGPQTDWHAVGIVQAFNLAYQAVNNVEPRRRFGRLCSRAMDQWLRGQGLSPASPRREGPVRIGLVGSHMHRHSVWHAITRGWVAELDRRHFELHLFHLGTTRDSETDWARERCASFHHGRGSLREWVDRIRGEELDVLLYPEIGMHHLTLQLASLRLAPLQLTSWGHPETSGLPTIDAFLSAQDMEPPGAEAAYTEELLRLPALGCCYQRPNVEAQALPDELPERAPGEAWLICPGSPFKYPPEYDAVLVALARELGPSRFFFFRHPSGVTRQLELRLRDAFTAAGLDADSHLCFLPWLSRGSFRALMAQADVYLDTIGFSGFNTALHAVEAGLPIVTVEGEFMRGRFAAAILRRLGLDEWVAADESGYRERVVRLARDAGLRAQVRQQMAERRDCLYGDTTPIRALESWLLARCRA